MARITSGAALALSLSSLWAAVIQVTSDRLPVTLNGQQTNMWCWAASGQMTMNYVHPASNVQQCDEANKEFGRTDCCNSPVPGPCVNGGWPEYTKYNFTADTTSDAALSWSQIQSQIYCAKKPFAFSWHWNGGGGTHDGSNRIRHDRRDQLCKRE